MVEHLVFTLCATLAANGDLAGHERRGTLTWPGRSAILGLLAAARGIRVLVASPEELAAMSKLGKVTLREGENMFEDAMQQVAGKLKSAASSF